MRALIHVNHLLGTGHAFRAAAIGRALVKRGVEVTLAAGNHLPETLNITDLNVAHLPVAKAADHAFSALVDETGKMIDAVWQRHRAERFFKLWQRTQPDIFVSEHFPFGRRKLAFEMVPVLQAIKLQTPKTLIAASVRDILVRKADPTKEQAMAELAKLYYDQILVHSDPTYIRLEDSFRFTDHIAPLITYTGFVHGHITNSENKTKGNDDIIVSVGGGAFGQKLIKTAIQAAAMFHDRRWRILAGTHCKDDELATLRTLAPDHMTIEQNRNDFVSLLQQAAVSISQAGYNTTLDVLATGISAIFVPSPVNGNEQRDRAHILARKERVHTLDEKTLTPERLIETITAILNGQKRYDPVYFDDGSVSADCLIHAWKHKSSRL